MPEAPALEETHLETVDSNDDTPSPLSEALHLLLDEAEDVGTTGVETPVATGTSPTEVGEARTEIDEEEVPTVGDLPETSMNLRASSRPCSAALVLPTEMLLTDSAPDSQTRDWVANKGEFPSLGTDTLHQVSAGAGTDFTIGNGDLPSTGSFTPGTCLPTQSEPIRPAEEHSSSQLHPNQKDSSEDNTSPLKSTAPSASPGSFSETIASNYNEKTKKISLQVPVSLPSQENKKTHKKDSASNPFRKEPVGSTAPSQSIALPSGEYPPQTVDEESAEMWDRLFGPGAGDSSEEGVRDPPAPTMDPVSWIWFRVEDGLGYDRVFIKPDDETLFSVIRTYALTCGVSPYHVHFSNGSCGFADDKPIRDLHIHNGSTIAVSVNLNCALPKHEYQWTHSWVQLSPVDHRGVRYREAGPYITRSDELVAEVILRDVWPGFPDILLQMRALKDRTVGDVVEAANGAICRRTFSLIVLNEMIDPDQELGDFAHEGYARVELTRSGNGTYPDLYRDEVEFHTELDLEPAETVRFVIEVVDDPAGVQGQNRRTGFGVSPTSAVPELVSKALSRFGLEGSHYLTHGFSSVPTSYTLGDLGFRGGSLYELELQKGTPSSALRSLSPPRMVMSESLVTLFVHRPEGDLVSIEVASDQILLNALHQADIRFHHPPRALEQGRRLHLLSTIEDLKLTSGSEIHVYRPLEGGGGARCASFPRASSKASTKRPASEVEELAGPPPAPSLRGEDGNHEAEPAGNEDNEPVSHPLPDEPPKESSEAIPEKSSLRVYYPFGDESHGVLRGEAKHLPLPTPDHFRFQFEGENIGRWGCLLQRDVPFATVTTYLESMYDLGPQVYMLNGTRLDADSTPADFDVEDLDLVYVSPPQIGGGPGSTGSSFAATRGQAVDSSDDEGGDYEDESEETIREHPHFRSEPLGTGTHQASGFSLQEAAGRSSQPTISDAVRDKSSISMGRPLDLSLPTSRPSLKGLIPAKGLQVSTFKGQNVKTFIARYERLGAAYGASPAEMVDYLLFYVCAEEPHDILSILETQDSYRDRDWPGVKEFLLQHFDGEDEDYKFTLNDLESFVKTPRTFDTKADLNLYTLQFREIGDRLLRAERITRPEAFRKYVRGLPPALRQSLQHSTFAKVNPTFDDIVKEVRDHFRPKHVFRLAQQVEERETSQQENSTPTRLPGLKFHSPGTSLRTNQHEDLSQQFAQMSSVLTEAMTKALTHVAPPTQGFAPRPPTPTSR
ncbi:hypothetical protein A4X13_0g7977 [Tilletia indica]|uniref:Ubiquitin-like domain-containing protein n=1 Tax=Tilletia indica TaxID=43049 RepID=A0A8T8SH26_9BASI|nr:hypothetical protein A4X13_0g7977 [Tilletia indica]